MGGVILELNEWQSFMDGAYQILMVEKHPIYENTFFIRMQIVGVIKKFWRREIKDTYELSKNEFAEFLVEVEPETTKEEILDKAFTYFKLIRNAVNSKDEEKRNKAILKSEFYEYYGKSITSDNDSEITDQLNMKKGFLKVVDPY